MLTEEKTRKCSLTLLSSWKGIFPTAALSSCLTGPVSISCSQEFNIRICLITFFEVNLWYFWELENYSFNTGVTEEGDEYMMVMVKFLLLFVMCIWCKKFFALCDYFSLLPTLEWHPRLTFEPLSFSLLHSSSKFLVWSQIQKVLTFYKKTSTLFFP